MELQDIKRSYLDKEGKEKWFREGVNCAEAQRQRNSDPCTLIYTVDMQSFLVGVCLENSEKLREGRDMGQIMKSGRLCKEVGCSWRIPRKPWNS